MGLSQEQLAKDAGVSVKSLSRVESGEGDSMLSTVEAVKAALEAHGIVFLGSSETLGPGLRVPPGLSFGWEAERAQAARVRERGTGGSVRQQSIERVRTRLPDRGGIQPIDVIEMGLLR